MTTTDSGLKVWLQSRLIDSTPDEMLEHLSKIAHAAESLRKQYGTVTLNLGCELSIFMSGIIPGRTFLRRVTWLGYFWWLYMLLPRFNSKLNQHLRKAVEVSRANFYGQITYGAGIWENVDWSVFDIVGLNFYREWSNQSSYVSDLRGFHRYNKPIVITEFGCCSYEGANKKGASGDSVVNYTKPVPELKGTPVRNEKVQADYLVDLINIFNTEGIYGAFVFEFIEPSHPYSPDPRHDLDIASFGIVRAQPISESDLQYRAEPKIAFHEISRLYGAG